MRAAQHLWLSAGLFGSPFGALEAQAPPHGHALQEAFPMALEGFPGMGFPGMGAGLVAPSTATGREFIGLIWTFLWYMYSDNSREC